MSASTPSRSCWCWPTRSRSSRTSCCAGDRAIADGRPAAGRAAQRPTSTGRRGRRRPRRAAGAAGPLAGPVELAPRLAVAMAATLDPRDADVAAARHGGDRGLAHPLSTRAGRDAQRARAAGSRRVRWRPGEVGHGGTAAEPAARRPGELVHQALTAVVGELEGGVGGDEMHGGLLLGERPHTHERTDDCGQFRSSFSGRLATSTPPSACCVCSSCSRRVRPGQRMS